MKALSATTVSIKLSCFKVTRRVSRWEGMNYCEIKDKPVVDTIVINHDFYGNKFYLGCKNNVVFG